MEEPIGTTHSISPLSYDISEQYFSLSDGKLCIKDVHLLTEVPNNVFFSTFSSICTASQAPLHLVHDVHSTSNKGGFLGFRKEIPSDRLMNSLGKFWGRNFLSIFRFKTWWSTQWVGSCGSDLQMETQWLLLDVPELVSYVIVIPIIEGKFRSALHPGCDGQVMISAESGSTQVKASSFDAIAYVHVSQNPYNLMKEAYGALRVYLNTFKLLQEKSTPPLLNKFGWCTWDSFYLTVDPAGVWHGLKEFSDGGISPRFLIIDDGWQSINLDGENPNEDAKNLVTGGVQMTARLHRLDEGEKFRNYKAGSILQPNGIPFDKNKSKMIMQKGIELDQAKKARDSAAKTGINAHNWDEVIQKLEKELTDMFDDKEETNGNGSVACKGDGFGLKAFTKDLRTYFKGLDDIYVWHAIFGAWGGVRPGTTHLNSKIISCKVSPGLEGTMDDLAVIKIVEGGIGVVHPDQANDFYNSMHSNLSNAGVTGVKVDVIQSIEYVGEDYGGRVDLAKAYYKGLSDSMVNNFDGNGVISSMQQCNDFFFLGTQQISMGRVADDFWFQDPYGDPYGVYWLQSVHMIHCAYNSLWMGQMIQPDWDMFQSDHLCAKFHAGSRAICGGPVYVSDTLGAHDFHLLNKIVYPDGTIPKCQHFALPTRDCLFKNPLFDGKTILKIWNFNKYGGVVGAFNCQGAGWDPKERRFKGYSECYKPMSGSVHVTDIEWDQNKVALQMGDEAIEFAIHLNQAKKLLLCEVTEITILPSTFEIFSFVPLKRLGDRGIKFAPIGLTNMLNSGGTIEDLVYNIDGFNGEIIRVKIVVKGGGEFLAYSSVSPSKCYLNGSEVGFEYFGGDGQLWLNLAWIEEAGGLSDVGIVF